MIGFRQFILENTELVEVKHTEPGKVKHKNAKGMNEYLPGLGHEVKNMKELGHKVSEKGEHHIYKRDLKHGHTEIYAYHPKTNKVHVAVYGKTHQHRGGHSMQIHMLAAHPESTVKAADVYHHLIHHHGTTLVSGDRQSPGGLKVWQKLAKKHDVSTHMFIPKNKRHPGKGGKLWNVDLAKKGPTLTHAKHTDKSDKAKALLVAGKAEKRNKS